MLNLGQGRVGGNAADNGHHHGVGAQVLAVKVKQLTLGQVGYGRLGTNAGQGVGMLPIHIFPELVKGYGKGLFLHGSNLLQGELALQVNLVEGKAGLPQQGSG